MDTTISDSEQNALEAIRRQLDVEFPHFSQTAETVAAGAATTLTDCEEDPLEAIRRQLDMEFAHFSPTAATVVAEEPSVVADELPARQRGEIAVALGLLLACGAGYGATLLVFGTVYEAFKTPPAVAVGRELLPAPVAAAPAVTVPVIAAPVETAPAVTSPPRAARPPLQKAPQAEVRTSSTAAARAPRAVARLEPASREEPTAPAVQPVPTVTRQNETPTTDGRSTPREVEEVDSTTAAPVASSPAPKRTLAARAAPLLELASQHARTAWGTVKETVKERLRESPGEFVLRGRSSGDAP